MPVQRPFRFGIINEQMGNAIDWIAQARHAESLGYATFLLRDHFVTEPFGDQFAPLIALTAAASATSKLRVGTLVLDNDYRHPVMLAKEAATLDLVSGGRFELGIVETLQTRRERYGFSYYIITDSQLDACAPLISALAGQ